MIRKDPLRYNNLINNQRPIAHKPMEAIKRAAQFSPFAALTGYDEEIEETARLTDCRIEFDENEISVLDRQLQFIQKHLSEKPEIEITYYVPDSESHKGSQKEGGAYVTHTGIIKRIDPIERKVFFYDGQNILIDRIADIDGEIFVDEYDF